MAAITGVFGCKEDTAAAIDVDGDGYIATDCDNTNPDIRPGAIEVCDGIDNDCDGAIDNDPIDGSTFYADSDGDQYGAPSVVDVLCEPTTGWVSNFDDCDDTSALNRPGADEICDEIDNDCDGAIDDDDDDLVNGGWSFDGDGDGYGDQPIQCSYSVGFVSEGGDCDDVDPTVNPGADELCDGIDNDCDDAVDANDDDTLDAIHYFPDEDEDGFGNIGFKTFSCVPIDQQITQGGDCDDTDPNVWPTNDEFIGNGVDDNCNSLQDEHMVFTADAIMIGEYASNFTGSAISGGFDVDGDTEVDMVIGAWGNDAEGEDAGLVHVVTDITIGTSDLTTQASGWIYGEEAGDHAGHSVDLYDIDGDDIADLIVGAPGHSDSAGMAYVIYGPISGQMELNQADVALSGGVAGDESGFIVHHGENITPKGGGVVIVASPGYNNNSGAVMVVSNSPVTNQSLYQADLTFRGPQYSRTGAAAAAVGDTNGDGHDDLLIGSPDHSPSDSYRGGTAWLLLGGVSGTIDSYNAESGFYADSAFDQLGSAVSGIGDVNGDGNADFMIGAPNDDSGHIDGGSVTVIVNNNSTIHTAFGRLLGTSYRELAGSAICNAGDVDGDGLDDALIGAPGSDFGGVDNGAVYLVYGSNLEGTQALIDAGEIYLGSNPHDVTGHAVSPAGDINNDGHHDFVIGSPGQSANGNSSGATYLFWTH